MPDATTSNSNGLRLKDVLDENNVEIDDSNQGMKDLLDSFQSFVNSLFEQKIFLSYSKSLDTAVSNICNKNSNKKKDIDVTHLHMIQSVVNLMKLTVDNDKKHPCTELRYVTLLEILLSYEVSGWSPSPDINSQWKRLNVFVERETDPEEFRRQAYQVLVSVPWVPSSYGLYTACSYEDSEALATWSDLPICLQTRLEQIPEPLMRSDRVHHILHKIRGRDSFTVTISYATPDTMETNSTMQTSGEGIGKSTLATLLAAHPTISDNYTIFWVDLLEHRWTVSAQEGDVAETSSTSSSMSHAQYMECLQRLCLQLEVPQNWPNLILRLENAHLRKLREKEHMKLVKRCVAEQGIDCRRRCER
jgi:hypothetical protein